MKTDTVDKIKDVWTQWLTKDIRSWTSFPEAVLATCRILDGGE